MRLTVPLTLFPRLLAVLYKGAANVVTYEEITAPGRLSHSICISRVVKFPMRVSISLPDHEARAQDPGTLTPMKQRR